jgi:hypothetical protein
MAESAGAPAPKRPARKRSARKSTTRKSATKTTAPRKRAASAKRTTTRRIAAAASKTGAKRGRPVGSKTRRTASSSPADAISKRIQALVKENQRLREQVSELEMGWKKLEKALGSNVTRARRAVRKTIDGATG